jgi:CheY-like chemotaxis protein
VKLLGAAVMVIDDDCDILSYLYAALADAGALVTKASSGAEALRLLEQKPLWDLVVTDLLMADMDGLEIIKECRSRRPTLRILAISGGGLGGGDLYLQTARALGAAATLAKPFDRTLLLRAIDAI